MGIYAERAFGYIYTVAEDGHFKLTDMKNFQVVADLTPGSSGLKYLMHNETRGVLIMADGDGNVYIYNQSVHPPEQVCKLQTSSQSCIRGLCMSTGGSYLVAGS